MEIKQFRYGRDNFSYVLFSSDEAIVIDAGAVKEILEFCTERSLRIRYIVNTHGHWDHVPGNEAFVKAIGIPALSFDDLRQRSGLSIASETIEIIFTPGHTLDSVCYYVAPILVTGDTLFNGTVGNCPLDRLDMFGESLAMLMTYPLQTQIYAGHDYYMDAVATIKTVDPHNPAIEAYIRHYDEKKVYSTLEMELTVNPYLRYDSSYYKHILRKKHLPHTTWLDRFKSIYEHIG